MKRAHDEQLHSPTKRPRTQEVHENEASAPDSASAPPPATRTQERGLEGDAQAATPATEKAEKRHAAELGSLRHLEQQIALLDAAVAAATNAAERDTIAAAKVQLLGACTLLRDSLGLAADEELDAAQPPPPLAQHSEPHGEGASTEHNKQPSDESASTAKGGAAGGSCVIHFTESIAGRKEHLEDRWVAEKAIDGLGTFFGLYDGHGGAACADYLQRNLHRNVASCWRALTSSLGGTRGSSDSGSATDSLQMEQQQQQQQQQRVVRALREGFSLTDRVFLQQAKRQGLPGGSTATTVLLHRESADTPRPVLFVANVGDSRVVLCRGGRAQRLTEDHKPDRRDERQRIEALGGCVHNVSGCWRVTREVLSEHERKQRVWLAVSRAFGDLQLKEPSELVSAEPEIEVVPLEEDDLLVLLACDGIWDVMHDQEAIDVASEHWGNPQKAADAVVKAAYRKRSQDNLSVQCIMFNWQLERGAAVVAKYHEARAEARRAALAREADGVDMFS